MSNNKKINRKIKANAWFINWFKYFEAYLELARIGLLQLDQQKYVPENLFKKGAIYEDQMLLIPIIWCLKHSIELLLKFLDVRITQECFLTHDNMELQKEIKTAFLTLRIMDNALLMELFVLSDKYFKLKFWHPHAFVISGTDIHDRMNDIFRYPESRANLPIEELYKITEQDKLEYKNDIKRLNKLSLKLYRQITMAKITKNKASIIQK